jgi:hypothetical protein
MVFGGVRSGGFTSEGLMLTVFLSAWGTATGILLVGVDSFCWGVEGWPWGGLGEGWLVARGAPVSMGPTNLTEITSGLKALRGAYCSSPKMKRPPTPWRNRDKRTIQCQEG